MTDYILISADPSIQSGHCAIIAVDSDRTLLTARRWVDRTIKASDDKNGLQRLKSIYQWWSNTLASILMEHDYPIGNRIFLTEDHGSGTAWGGMGRSNSMRLNTLVNGVLMAMAWEMPCVVHVMDVEKNKTPKRDRRLIINNEFKGIDGKPISFDNEHLIDAAWRAKVWVDNRKLKELR